MRPTQVGSQKQVLNRNDAEIPQATALEKMIVPAML